MTRRRAIFGVLGLVALATTWWLLSDPLTSDEQRLVGRWLLDVPVANSPNKLTYIVEFDQDRHVRVRHMDPTTGAHEPDADGLAHMDHARWRVSDRRLCFVWDTGLVVRVRRMLPEGIPGSLPTVRDEIAISAVTDDEIILRDAHGEERRMRRAPTE
jgi:hypothetical protein